MVYRPAHVEPGENAMSDKKRRKLLKSIAAGSGAVITGKTLPESWTRPMVDSVALPAHAETSLVCCEGVFCNLDFGQNEINGSAQVSSDCTIIMEGDSAVGPWSGSGTVAADGSFSFPVIFVSAANQQVNGSVTESCLRIDGTMTNIGNFNAPVTQGVTSINQCIA
jgi:hypothetical protein